MARTNKYTSLNFNDIFDKTTTSTTSSATSTSRSASSSALSHKSYSLSASSRLSHGGMLVLSRPSAKPQPPQPQPQPQPPPPTSQLKPVDFPSITSPQSSKPLDSDSMISLRPQGKTGGGGIGSGTQERLISNKVEVPTPTPTPTPKSNKFVPPHLRPGFVPKEVPSVPEFQKPRPGNYHRPGSAHGNYRGSPNQYGDDGRPMSGSGFHRPGSANGYGDDGRPRSGGGYNRPGSAHGNYHGLSNGYGDNGRPNSGGGYHHPGSVHGNYYGSSNGYGDNGTPNSGGGYDRRMRGAGAGALPFAGGESESYRPRSGGSRPNSSG